MVNYIFAHDEYREITAVVRLWWGWWWWQFLEYSWAQWSCCRRRWWCCSGGARLPASTSGWKRPRGINTARSNPPPSFPKSLKKKERLQIISTRQWVEEADNVNSTRGGLLFVQLSSLRTTSKQVPKVKSSYTLVAANSHLNFVCTSDWTTRTTWTT